jgi:hypothetical protein
MTLSNPLKRPAAVSAAALLLLSAQLCRQHVDIPYFGRLREKLRRLRYERFCDFPSKMSVSASFVVESVENGESGR